MFIILTASEKRVQNISMQYCLQLMFVIYTKDIVRLLRTLGTITFHGSKLYYLNNQSNNCVFIVYILKSF